ncbi:lipoprotein 17-related variable surface protein [Mycoplasmopsis columbinasalis]|uniref:Lipoprotein associated domain n=1 Tax=Mycoplasmopsis columbinasalis TaxID=114880 RepID=A0A449B9K6_9BACT|nr:lipoprotein 17-related variable surface protein [Mycoplasmopsis columbinasalis]VEU77845.1 Lipoprotein associated domain [Mycoplasmopsis columbinasalis]
MKLKKFSFLLSATAATVAVPLVAVSCGKIATTEVTAKGEIDKITAVVFTGTDQANTSVNNVTKEQLKLKAGEADYKAPTGSDVKVVFEITTRLAVDGSLKVKVSVQKGAETPLTKELPLTGFKAEPAIQNVTQAEVDAEAAKITAVEYNGTEASVKDKVLPSQVDDAKLVVKAGEQGYVLPVGGSWATEFVKTPDDVAGTLKVKVKVTSGTLFAESKEVTLDGFLTSANKKAAEVQAEANKITNVEYLGTREKAKDKVLPSAVTVTKTNFKAKENDKDYVVPAAIGEKVWSWDVVKVSANDAEGKLTVKVTITFDGESKDSKDFVLEGFLTAAAKKDAEIQAEANKITAVEYLGTDANAKDKVLPSAVTFINTNFKAKVNNNNYDLPTAVEGKAWSLDFVKVLANDAEGKLTVKVKVTFDGVSKESTNTFELEGFLTTDQDNKNKADAEATRLAATQVSITGEETWADVNAFVAAYNNGEAAGQTLRGKFSFANKTPDYSVVFRTGATPSSTEAATKATLKFTVSYKGQASEETAVDFTVPITPAPSQG